MFPRTHTHNDSQAIDTSPFCTFRRALPGEWLLSYCLFSLSRVLMISSFSSLGAAMASRFGDHGYPETYRQELHYTAFCTFRRALPGEWLLSYCLFSLSTVLRIYSGQEVPWAYTPRWVYHV
jgi:hypothetical protein